MSSGQVPPVQIYLCRVQRWDASTTLSRHPKRLVGVGGYGIGPRPQSAVIPKVKNWTRALSFAQDEIDAAILAS
jgi:hypothetical protein